MVEAESCRVAPSQMAPLFEAVGGDGWLIVRIPIPVDDWPSGLVTVTFLAPFEAPTVEMFSVTWVGSVNMMLLTPTPPDTEPETEVPVPVTLTEGTPGQKLAGEALAGVAGAVAFSWTA